MVSTRLSFFCFALCAMLFALFVPAGAQEPSKVPRIGYPSSSNPATESARAEAIRLALRELGYIEGQNIAIEYRIFGGKGNRGSGGSACVRAGASQSRYHRQVAGGAPVIRAAQLTRPRRFPSLCRACSGSYGIDILGEQRGPLVAGLARPGGNFTGVTILDSEGTGGSGWSYSKRGSQNSPRGGSLALGRIGKPDAEGSRGGDVAVGSISNLGSWNMRTISRGYSLR